MNIFNNFFRLHIFLFIDGVFYEISCIIKMKLKKFQLKLLEKIIIKIFKLILF